MDQWRGYLQPGRFLKRGSTRFALKKEEINLSGLNDVEGVFTKEQILNYVRDARPEFRLQMAQQDLESGGGYTDSDDPMPELWKDNLGGDDVTLGGITDEQFAGLEDLNNRLLPKHVEYGRGSIGDSYTVLPDDAQYQESVTRLTGLQAEQNSH